MRRSYLSSCKSVLSKRPLVVGTLVGNSNLSTQIKRASSRWIDIIEVRLDTFSEVPRSLVKAIPFSQKLLRRVSRQTKKPLLLTLRSVAELRRNIRYAEHLSRQSLIQSLLPLCQLIDLEIRDLSFTKELTRQAHSRKVDVIHSLHDFTSASQLSHYEKYAQLSQNLNGDIFKIAVTPKNNQELDDFLLWGHSLKNLNKILIGMGAVGLPSRYIGFSFGSKLTYGHLGASAAPGQPLATPLGEFVRKCYSA